MRNINFCEESEERRNPIVVEPLMSSKELALAAPESNFPKARSIILPPSSLKQFTSKNPVEFQEATLRIIEHEYSPSSVSGGLNCFSNGDVHTDNALYFTHHSCCTTDDSVEKPHVFRQEDLEAPKSAFDAGVPTVTNCCCQVLREQLAIEVMRRLSVELALQKMEEEIEKIRIPEGKMEEVHVSKEGCENINKLLKNVGTGGEREKKDLDEEVMKLRCILESRDKEIEEKKIRIAFLQNELVSQMLCRDTDNHKRRIRSRERDRISSITTDSTLKSRRTKTPTRSLPGMISAVNLSQSPLASPSPRTRSSLKNKSASFTVHTPNISLSSGTRLKAGLRQKGSMDRLSTPSRSVSPPFKNASFFSYQPFTSRTSPSCERAKSHSGTINLSSSASGALNSMIFTPNSQSSHVSQTQLNALRSAIRPFSPNTVKESSPRSSGSVAEVKKKWSSLSDAVPSSGNRNANTTCDSAFHLSGTDSRKATPLRSHPASRPTPIHGTSRTTRRNSAFANDSTFTTTAAAYREASLKVKPSCCYSRRNERTKLSEGTVDVCYPLEELIGPLPLPFTPLKCTLPSQSISRSVLSLEKRRLNLSSKRGRNEANTIKGTTTTVTFGKSKTNDDELRILTSRSLPCDPSYDSVVDLL